MSDHASYPESMPTHCFAELGRIVATGRIAEEKSAFALHAWNVQGYLQSIVLGDGEHPPLIGGLPELADEEACQHLQAMAPVTANGHEAVKAAMPAALLLRWVIKKLVENLI